MICDLTWKGVMLLNVYVQGSSKLDQKVQQLLDWNTRRSVITLSSEKFSSYVRTKPRNYSVIATFTALKPQRQCSVCKWVKHKREREGGRRRERRERETTKWCIFLFRDAFDEFTILADSWRYSQQYSSSLFFVLIDIDEDGMDAFQQVRTTNMFVCVSA